MAVHVGQESALPVAAVVVGVWAVPVARCFGRHASIVVEAVAASLPSLERMAVSEREISGRLASGRLPGLLCLGSNPMDYLPDRQCLHCGKLSCHESIHVAEPSRPAHL